MGQTLLEITGGRKGDGDMGDMWRSLAEDVVIPALKGAGGKVDGAQAARLWYEVSGRDWDSYSPDGLSSSLAVQSSAALVSAKSMGTHDMERETEELEQSIRRKVSQERPSSAASATSTLYGGGSRRSAQESLERMEDSITRKSKRSDGGHQRSIFEDLDRLEDIISLKSLHSSIIPVEEEKDQAHESLEGRTNHSKGKHAVSDESHRDATNEEGRFGKDDAWERVPIRHGAFPVGPGGADLDGHFYGHGVHGNGQDGLAVAVGVDTEEDVFIPSAYECQPDSKPPLYRNRRFQTYTTAALCFVVVAVVGGVVAVVMKTTESFRTTAAVEIKTSHPTLAPTPVSWTNGVKEQIEEMVQLMAKENVMAGNADNLDEDDPILPYRLAMSWILEKDIRRLQKDSPNIIQRYLLALLYYSTDKEKDWKYCAPLDEGVVETNENTLCEAEMYDHDGEPFNKTARRFLSGAHECDWYGVDCPGGDQFVRVVEMSELCASHFRNGLLSRMVLLLCFV